jgi:hypothetical protein
MLHGGGLLISTRLLLVFDNFWCGLDFDLAWVELVTIEEDTELFLFLQSIVTAMDRHGVARINRVALGVREETRVSFNQDKSTR